MIDRSRRFRARGRWTAVVAAALAVPLACRAPSSGDPDAGASAAGAGAGGEKEVVVPAEQGLPFSPVVRVTGPLLFLSGQIGNEPGTLELVEGGIQAETRRTLENIRSALQRAGASLDDVVKCTAFLADMSEWEAMNEVYSEFFAQDPPARSALGASGLALGAAVEIECIAVAPGTG